VQWVVWKVREASVGAEEGVGDDRGVFEGDVPVVDNGQWGKLGVVVVVQTGRNTIRTSSRVNWWEGAVIGLIRRVEGVVHVAAALTAPAAAPHNSCCVCTEGPESGGGRVKSQDIPLTVDVITLNLIFDIGRQGDSAIRCRKRIEFSLVIYIKYSLCTIVTTKS
jgi:hypothetical protein